MENITKKIFKKILDNENYLVISTIPIILLILLITQKQDFSYWTQYWWMFPIALIVAITVNTLGISGSALFVPFFVLIFPLLAIPLLPEQSVKLGLITESFGLSSSALAFLRYGLVDLKLGALTIIGAAPLVIFGAYIAFFIPEFLFHFLIGGILLLSIVMLLNKKRLSSKIECIIKDTIGQYVKNSNHNITKTSIDGKTYKYCRENYFKRGIGYGIGGLLQGIGGFGIGEIGIVSMVLTKIPIRIAIGTSHIIVASTAIIASITYLLQSSIYHIQTPWNILFMTIPAVIIGGQVAPYIAGKLETSTLERFISGLFIILSIILFYIGMKGLI